jgi:hypothetical protein
MIEKTKHLAVSLRLEAITCSPDDLIAAARMAILNTKIDPKKTTSKADFAAARRAIVIQRIAEGYQVDLREPGAARTLINELKKDPAAQEIGEKIEKIMGDRFDEMSCNEEELEAARAENLRSSTHPSQRPSTRPDTDKIWRDEYESPPPPPKAAPQRRIPTATEICSSARPAVRILGPNPKPPSKPQPKPELSNPEPKTQPTPPPKLSEEVRQRLKDQGYKV